MLVQCQQLHQQPLLCPSNRHDKSAIRCSYAGGETAALVLRYQLMLDLSAGRLNTGAPDGTYYCEVCLDEGRERRGQNWMRGEWASGRTSWRQWQTQPLNSIPPLVGKTDTGLLSSVPTKQREHRSKAIHWGFTVVPYWCSLAPLPKETLSAVLALLDSALLLLQECMPAPPGTGET